MAPAVSCWVPCPRLCVGMVAVFPPRFLTEERVNHVPPPPAHARHPVQLRLVPRRRRQRVRHHHPPDSCCLGGGALLPPGGSPARPPSAARAGARRPARQPRAC